ncbi:MAG: hypothetical protein Q8Q67_03860 [bacterium]|nr:hypothetical protein [bacterium]
MKINRFVFNFYDFWILLMLYLSAGALVYYFYALDWLGIAASLLITGFMYYALRPSLRQIKPSSEQEEKSISGLIYGFLSLGLAITAIIIAFQARTDSAIITPWTEVSAWFFVALSLSALALILALSRNISATFKKVLLFSFFVSIFCVAAIVYRLCYGFDPFIHQAAMAEISRYGFISPKTPYYLGQYSLVTFLDKIGLSVFYVNQWLLPLLSALSLALILPYLHRGRRDKAATWLASLSLLFIGFSPLIMTTPQNFSYLLLLITIIFLYKNAPWSLSVTTAVAAFAVHPLAGLPAIFLSAWILAPRVLPHISKWRVYRKPAYILGAAIVAFSLSIWAIAGFGPLQLQSYNLDLLMPVLTNQETYALDLAYFLIKNYFWLLLTTLVLIFFGRRRLWPNEESNSFRVAKVLALSALAAMIAYLISRGFHFEGLIAYEQDDYAARLPVIALIIVIPLFWEFFYQASHRALALSRPAKISTAIGLSLLLLVAVYASYPRFDNYHNSRGYSTSAADVAAVRAAEELSAGEKYIVLTNQQVSAAALREFGFRERYLQVNGDEMYFYPIPTGGPLYQYFLDMVYIKADRETMTRAMTMVGVDRSFLIINRYWWASDKIIAEAKLSADSWQRLNQGDVHVFEYIR